MRPCSDCTSCNSLPTRTQVHGIGETLWHRAAAGVANLRDATAWFESFFIRARAEEAAAVAGDAAAADARAKGFDKESVAAAAAAARASVRPTGR
jgi:hypothetical protein